MATLVLNRLFSVNYACPARSAQCLPCLFRSALHRAPSLNASPLWSNTIRWYSYSCRLQKKHESIKSQTTNGQDSASNESEQKTARASSQKTSLRRVAVEAERSRGNLIRGRGRYRFVDPEVVTQTVTAYCAAEQYNVYQVSRLLKAEGYQVDPLRTNLYPQVVHIRPKNSPMGDSPGSSSDAEGDMFVFPSGTVVTWNVNERTAQYFVTKLLLPASEGPRLLSMETESMEYLVDSTRENSSIVGDTIILGTKVEERAQEYDSAAQRSIEAEERDNLEVDTILAKIAFSSGLARSTKLSVLESLLSAYFDSTRSIPILLSQGSKLPFTRPFILRKTGELLSIRAQLNLYSELTDSLPDLFWESRHELGLEGYYDEVGRALDVGVRIKSLNEKMDYAQEIASVLRERLSEKHGLLLEWGIIALISIEVVFEIMRIWKEREERLNPKGTEALLRRFLHANENTLGKT